MAELLRAGPRLRKHLCCYHKSSAHRQPVLAASAGRPHTESRGSVAILALHRAGTGLRQVKPVAQKVTAGKAQDWDSALSVCHLKVCDVMLSPTPCSDSGSALDRER